MTKNDLLVQIVESLERTIDRSKTQVLLLSDGKDSLSLAIALSKKGIKCKTLTLLRNDDNELESYIKQVCSELGHEPYFVTVDDIAKVFDLELLNYACSLMNKPVLDQGFIFFLFGLKNFFANVDLLPSDCELIDGLGNDEHLGCLPSKNQYRAYIFSKLGLWKYVNKLPRGFNWYLRSPAEANGDLSALACFFDFKQSYDLNNFFSKIKIVDDTSFVDFRAFSRGSFHDHDCMIQKTKIAAKALGASIVYPWTDPKLALYCFNLPIKLKYNFKENVNKLPLRKLLIDQLNWKQEKRGVDLYFDLDICNFINNIALVYVTDEIIDRIMQNRFVSIDVKKRALLELVNLASYSLSLGYNKADFSSFLLGD